MTHPSNDVLLAHVDGELADIEAAGVARHLAGCDVCAAAVARLRETVAIFAGVLHGVDALEPEGWQARPSADVLPFRPVAGPSRAAGRRQHGPVMPQAWRWAAGVLLFTGAAAAATLAVRSDIFRSTPSAVVTPAASPGGAPESGGGAVAVRADAGGAQIALTNALPSSRLELVIEDRADVRVVVDGAVAPHFTARDGRVDVDLGAQQAAISIRLPRSLRTARVTVDGVTVVTLEDGVVTPAAAAAGGITLDGGTGPQRMP